MQYCILALHLQSLNGRCNPVALLHPLVAHTNNARHATTAKRDIEMRRRDRHEPCWGTPAGSNGCQCHECVGAIGHVDGAGGGLKTSVGKEIEHKQNERFGLLLLMHESVERCNKDNNFFIFFFFIM
jgi:hypothetical protein